MSSFASVRRLSLAAALSLALGGGPALGQDDMCSRFKPATIIKASMFGCTAAVRRLIAAGADVHARIDAGYTALMFASGEGHTEVVRVLIDAGASVRARSDDGWTALMEASRKGHTETVKVLRNHWRTVELQPEWAGVM